MVPEGSEGLEPVMVGRHCARGWPEQKVLTPSRRNRKQSVIGDLTRLKNAQSPLSPKDILPPTWPYILNPPQIAPPTGNKCPNNPEPMGDMLIHHTWYTFIHWSATQK